MVDKIQFLGIGAPRCGTTWLYDRLSEHPDFQLPKVKEIHYFDRDKKYISPNDLSEEYVVKRLLNPLWTGRAVKSCLQALKNEGISECQWLLKWHFSRYDDNFYLSLFDGMNGVCGEITPSYMLLDEVDLKRIYSLFPNLKTVFLMRDPIERSWSSYRKSYLQQGQKLPDIDSIIEYLDGSNIVQRANYLDALNRYQRHALPGNMLVGFYDSIVEQPAVLLENIVTFLGGNCTENVRHCRLDAISNASPRLDIPDEIMEYLRERYFPQMRELSDIFGGYCNRWMNRHFGVTLDDDTVRASLLLDDYSLERV